MAQIINITSEALQATIRRLLPSQQGFGEDLQATNVVQPIIDLTPTAEGTVLRQDLATALNHGNATTFAVSNNTVTLTNTVGFFRVFGAVNCDSGAAGAARAQFSITDGSTSKVIWKVVQFTSTAQSLNVDFTVFLRPDDSLQAQTNDTNVHMNGATYPIADVKGNLIPPAGFVFE